MPTTIGQAIGVGKRLMSRSLVADARMLGNRAWGRAGAWAGSFQSAQIMNTPMNMAGMRSFMRSAPMMTARGAMGRSAMIGMGVGAGLNMGQQGMSNMRNGRFVGSGMIGAGFRGAMGGGFAGGMFGAGRFLLR